MRAAVRPSTEPGESERVPPTLGPCPSTSALIDSQVVSESDALGLRNALRAPQSSSCPTLESAANLMTRCRGLLESSARRHRRLRDFLAGGGFRLSTTPLHRAVVGVNGASYSRAVAPIDVKKTAELLDAISENSDGHLLEDLVRSLFETIPGVAHYAQDVLSASGNEEIDIAFSNRGDPDGLVNFGSDVLVECKAQGKPVSAADVSWFATKLRRRG